jgi:hypothetical protein
MCSDNDTSSCESDSEVIMTTSSDDETDWDECDKISIPHPIHLSNSKVTATTATITVAQNFDLNTTSTARSNIFVQVVQREDHRNDDQDEDFEIVSESNVDFYTDKKGIIVILD